MAHAGSSKNKAHLASSNNVVDVGSSKIVVHIRSPKGPSIPNMAANKGKAGEENKNLTHVGTSKAASFSNAATNKDKAGGENKPVKLCNWKNLTDLLLKEPNDLLLSLLCPKLGFLNLLASSITNDRILSLTMEVIARACLSEHARSALLEFLRQVNDSCFLKQVFVQYLGNFLATCNGESLDERLIMASLFVFENLLKKLPSKSMPIVTLLLTQIKIATMQFSPSEEIQDTIRQIEEIMRDNQRQIQMGNLMRDQEAVESTSWDPAEKFRRLSVVPTSKDLHGQRDPLLSKNIIYGKYKNVSNYLDVQFRLLREDLIRPLREGLADLLEWKKRNNYNSRLSTNIKLYTKVHIVSPNFASRGLVYKVNFDMRRLKNVVWERSKRLNFGALVCLSSDNFKTILVATVAERGEIKQGEIQLMFQNEESRQLIDLRSEMSYEMIESPAYFEAYKPVLEGLQFMDEYSLPFLKYLLNHRENYEPVAPPGYLLRNEKAYDFKCIMKNSCELKSDPLIYDTWPNADQLGLDVSQYNALRSALTTEFVLIQGPPGTGKTYIGLKIVQVLLANEFAWNSIYLRMAMPILIVCFTNHALDQFLELILEGDLIEKNSVDLVRIGSQSKSEILKPHHIKEVKRRMGVFRYSDYSDNRHTAFDKMQQLQKQIIPLAAYIELSKENILCDSKLQRYMTASQTNTLLSRRIPTESILFKWLMVDKRQAHEIMELAENTDIEEENEIEAELEDVEEEDKEDDKDNMNLTNKENFKATKSEMLLAGDFLVEEHGHPGDKIKQLRIVYRANRDIMTETEANNCENVWTLDSADRWRLYNYWVSQHMEPEIQQLKDLLVEHDIQSDIVSEIGKEEDYRCMRSAKIIGMTTTGSARYRDVLQRVQPRIIIVEEAAEVLEAHIVTSLSKGCEHLILIGDHQQLRPNPTVYQLATDYHLNISLFERMVLNELHCERLSIQHRMRPEIVELIVPHIYKTLTNADSVLLYENVWGILGNIFFLNHSIEEQGADDGQSHSNLHEAQFVSALAQYFMGVGYKPSQITVLTTYTGQMFLLRKHMPRSYFDGVRITPVDNYQGEENDIILLSLVRSNRNGNIGFLKIPNRVCVALSRAKKGCFIVGNGDQLANGSRLWHDIIASLKKCNRFVNSLPLACHKHPENVINVSNESDFRLIPFGGCSYSCDYRLDCGHVCDLKCHHFDPKHEEYMCKKKCTRSCPADHLCKKLCYLECGDCQVLMQEKCVALLHTYSRKCFENIPNCTILVEKILTRCRHTEMVPCHLPENRHLCKAACPKSCKRGHPCQKLCSEKCVHCEVPVEKILPSCKHTNLMPCFIPRQKYKCKKPCKTICPNSHPCSQPCHERCRPCTVLIEKELSRCHHLEMVPCHRPEEQHKCESPCRTLCPSSHPCTKKCHEYCGDCVVMVEKSLPKCKHTALLQCSKSVLFYKCLKPCEKLCPMGHPCAKPCSQLCGICEVEVDKILPQCKHMQRIGCYKNPEYEQCKLPCEKVLKCGHNCTKLCGEACPIQCQVIVPDILLPCLHRAALPCSADSKTHKCTNNVEVTLCTKGHTKMIPCHRSSSYKIGAYECDAMIETTCSSVMKHKSKIKCYEQTAGRSMITCRTVCDFMQSCGHRCKQKCSSCTSANKHQNCIQRCSRKLPLCSHNCLGKCFELCPPCTFDCAQSCRHGKCRHRCSEPCIPCREPCDWTCPHYTCQLTCSESCTRPACDEPCRRKLSCKHQCRGLCGEPCPDKCFTCSPKQVKALETDLMVFKITKSTRFVQLRPCGDILPVEYMDNWVNEFTTNETSAIKSLKRFLTGIICPLKMCKREVEYCPRYNALIKRVACSQVAAKSKIIRSKQFLRKLEKAKDEWESFSKEEDCLTAQLYSRLDVYTIWLWNECRLRKEISDKDKVSFRKICENIEQEEELVDNVKLGDLFETCMIVIGLSRLYLLLNVVCLSIVTRGPKLCVLDKCLKRLSSTNVDTDTERTWRCVITVNDALKENFKVKSAEGIVDLRLLFETEINITSLHSTWTSCTRGHVYVYNEDQLGTDADLDLHCPTCHSIETILSDTLLWPVNTSSAEQRIEQESSITAADSPDTAAADVKLESEALADTEENKGARYKTVSSPKQWTLENKEQEETNVNKGARPKTVSSAKQWTLELNTQTEATRNARGYSGPSSECWPFQRGNFNPRGQQNASWRNKDDRSRPQNDSQIDHEVDWRSNKKKYTNNDNDGWTAPAWRGGGRGRAGSSRNVTSGIKSFNDFEEKTNGPWRKDNIGADNDDRFQRDDPGHEVERINDNLTENHRVEETRWNFPGNYPPRRGGTNLAARSRGMGTGRGYRGKLF